MLKSLLSRGKSKPLDITNTPVAKTKSNNKIYLISTAIIVSSLIIAGIIVLYQPITDYYVLKDANPAMVLLAEQAGMSREGELIFLRSNPTLATDSQMLTDCANNAAANNKNGFIEQGCYVPNPHDNSTGRIYIRQMPANLYDQEIVTAAYEMLHSIYFSDNSSRLVMAIESNYNQLQNPALDEQVVNFAKTEPGYRDLELFSLLGTEYSNISPSLEKYYSPYFYNRSLTVSSYSTVISTFQTEQSQIKQLQASIATDSSLANKAYADSLAWAKVGNAYEDSYDYGIYKSYIAQENTAIGQYNQLSQTYNTLVTDYNGTQPVSALQNVTTQSSK